MKIFTKILTFTIFCSFQFNFVSNNYKFLQFTVSIVIWVSLKNSITFKGNNCSREIISYRERHQI